jgi:hypothetical protein
MFFFWRGELAVTAAVSWQPGEHAQALWAWVCESMSRAGEDNYHPLPSARTWAAMAAHIDALGIGEAVQDFARLMAAALVEWAAAQN